MKIPWRRHEAKAPPAGSRAVKEVWELACAGHHALITWRNDGSAAGHWANGIESRTWHAADGQQVKGWIEARVRASLAVHPRPWRVVDVDQYGVEVELGYYAG